MKFLVFIAPNEFKDETVAMVRTFFKKWGIGFQITSYSNKDCVGYHGAVYKPDINTAKVKPGDYDGIFLVDGNGVDNYRLYEYRPLLDLIMQMNNASKYVCGVDNAIKIIARANIVKDKKIAMPADEETKRLVQLFHGVPTDNGIEPSKNIITIGSSRNLDSTLQEMLNYIGVI